RRIVADEERIQLTTEKLCRGRLLEDDVDNILAVKVALAAEELLLVLVVELAAEHEDRLRLRLAPVATDQDPEPQPSAAPREAGDAKRPAGEGARRFLDVLLRVVADAHGE